MIQKHRIQALLMGGQACVLYGAAEFSKDFDFVILISLENLKNFGEFIREIQAEVIAVPPFEIQYLEKGHSVHFRAGLEEMQNLRIDIMTNLRGVAPFPDLWQRRSTAEILPGLSVEMLSLPDLVQAKKTQRDKDWPMIRRLVDVHYVNSRQIATNEQVKFWLLELRTPQFLIECISAWPEVANEICALRNEVLSAALGASVSGTQKALDAEQAKIREIDRVYWMPLRKELEELRRKRKKN